MGRAAAPGEYSWKAEGGGDWNTEVARFVIGRIGLEQTPARAELDGDASIRS